MNFKLMSVLDKLFEQKMHQTLTPTSALIEEIRRKNIIGSLEIDGEKSFQRNEIEARGELVSLFLDMEDVEFRCKIDAFVIANTLLTLWFNRNPCLPHPDDVARNALQRARIALGPVPVARPVEPQASV